MPGIFLVERFFIKLEMIWRWGREKILNMLFEIFKFGMKRDKRIYFQLNKQDI